MERTEARQRDRQQTRINMCYKNYNMKQMKSNTHIEGHSYLIHQAYFVVAVCQRYINSYYTNHIGIKKENMYIGNM